MPTYLEELRRRSAASKTLKAPMNTTEIITCWFNNLPPEAQRTARTMDEILRLLPAKSGQGHAAARDVAKVLTVLGWQRRRTWAKPPYRRYWVPPTFQHNGQADET